MTNQVKKKTTYSVIILSLAVIALIVGAFLLSARINNTMKQIRNFVDDLSKRSRSTEELRAALKNIRETRQEVESYGVYLFNTDEDLKLITDLENIAARDHVSQTVLSSSLDNPATQPITISLAANGQYTDLLRYIRDLEKYDYFIGIESLEIFPTGGAESGEAALRINLTIYANQ